MLRRLWHRLPRKILVNEHGNIIQTIAGQPWRMIRRDNVKHITIKPIARFKTLIIVEMYGGGYPYLLYTPISADSAKAVLKEAYKSRML